MSQSCSAWRKPCNKPVQRVLIVGCRRVLLLALLLCAALPTPGQQRRGAWGDLGDGSYANPVLPADYSDLDVIRVGKMFYAISSTFQYSPGMAVLASHDLVNWSTLSHVVPDITRISPAMSLARGNREGRGIWAGAIRYHAGRYWVYFGTPDEGLFLSTARDPQGPWSPVVRVLPEVGWDDPCPFWDRDGKGYLVATHFAPDAQGVPYTIHLFRLSEDGEHLVPGTDRVIHHSEGSEANKLYRIHGRYYHYYSEVRPEGRVAMMERARSLAGPWETRQLIHVNAAVDKEPNQGGLVQLASGQWYFLSHQGTGDWEGRAAVLLPVTWRDGWPLLGRVGADDVGNMVWGGPKPISGFARTSPVGSDRFEAATLRPEWEWRYQPPAEAWSLAGHRLRLAALPAGQGAGLLAGSLLTQRAMRTSRNEVTVELDLAGMQPGQQAGMVHYAATAAALRVEEASDGVRRLVCRAAADAESGGAGDQVVQGPPLEQTLVWLRSTWNGSGVSYFSYSLDGRVYTELGPEYRLTWAHYRGDRIGLSTTAAAAGEAPEGYVEVVRFRYDVAR